MSMSIDGVRLEASAAPEGRAPVLARAAPDAPKSPDFAGIWRRVGGAIDRGEALIGRAGHAAGGQMDAGTLIALQAGIYRYGEAIDLTVKVVDRVSSAVRTILESGR
jgi:hypothetical protein